MIDLSQFEGRQELADLLAEMKQLRSVGKQLAEVASMIAAEREPLHPDCIKCEQIDQQKARAALTAWRAL